MSKLYNRLIQIRLSGSLPSEIYWRRKWRTVVSINYIRVKRDYYDPYCWLDTYRAVLDNGVVCDLVQTKDGWVLERVWD
ncbi:MAG: hypothetical protein WC364_12450 [Eubacteriales bacterium]|jgi:hypothetical protein